MSRVCQQCIHLKDLRIKLPLISFERTEAGKPHPTTFQTRGEKQEKNRNPEAESECPIFLIFADLLSKTTFLFCLCRHTVLCRVRLALMTLYRCG